MMRKLSTDRSMESYSDEDLLVLIHSEGHNKFAGELYKRYSHLVYGICYKYLKDQTNSKDVLMDIFETLLKKPPPREVASFKKWLFTVTKNECLTFLRNSKRSAGREIKTEDFEKKADFFMENEDVERLNSRIDSETKMLTALKQLKAPQQQCIQLFYLKGKSYKEIEENTDFTLKQIKSYLQNGKRKLKLLIESTKV